MKMSETLWGRWGSDGRKDEGERPCVWEKERESGSVM